MRFILLLVAAVIAVFAGVAALQLSSKNTAPGVIAQAMPSQNVSTVDVIVARAPIPAGTVITAAMIDKQPWPDNLVLEGFIVGNTPESSIVGKVTRSSLQAREPLLTSKLANTTDAGFLAATLPPGMRAVTIATDAVSGVAGFVFPGDRVDVVFTHNIPSDGSSDRPAYAEVLAANVPVLAVNLREASLKDEVQPLGMGAPTPAIAPSSMTLQVTDVQAEKLRLAEKVGTMSISLRSISDKENTAVTAPADLSSLTNVHMSEMEVAGVKVVRGNGTESGTSAFKQVTRQMEQK